MVTDADLSVGRLYPPLDNIREISVKIATKVATEAYQESTASTYPEPEVRNEAPAPTRSNSHKLFIQDKESLVRSYLYDYNYDDYPALPTLYKWPEEVQKPFLQTK